MTGYKISLLPPQLRRVVELRFDHQNFIQRDDAEVARLLNGSVDEVREWTMMAFKLMRELDGVLPVPALEPDEPKRVFVICGTTRLTRTGCGNSLSAYSKRAWKPTLSYAITRV